MQDRKTLHILAAATLAVPGLAMAVSDFDASRAGPATYLAAQPNDAQVSLMPRNTVSTINALPAGTTVGRYRGTFGLSNIAADILDLATPFPTADNTNQIFTGRWVPNVDNPATGAVEDFETWAPITPGTGVTFPDGPGDTALFDNFSGGEAVFLNQSVTLQKLQFNDVGSNKVRFLVSGNTLVALSGNEIFGTTPAVDGVPAGSGGSSIGFSGAANIEVNQFGKLSVPITSSGGLNVTGGAVLQMTVANPGLSGAITADNAQISVSGGDNILGSGTSPVTLTNGGVLFYTNTRDATTPNVNTARNINIAGTGTKIIAATGTNTFSGVISGAAGQELLINALPGDSFTASAPNTTPITITGTNTFAGNLRTAGQVNLTGNGSFANAASISTPVGGGNFQSFKLDYTGAGAVNRLNDAGSLTLEGAHLEIQRGGTSFAETAGSLRLTSGTSFITIGAGSGGSTGVITFSNLNRVNESTLYLRAPGLGGASQVKFASAPATVGGITKGVYANSETSLNAPGYGAEEYNNTLTTYSPATGITPIAISAYNTSIAAGGNVRLAQPTTPPAGPNRTVFSGSGTVNSLVIAASPATPGFGGVTGVDVSLNGPLTVTSGHILNAFSGLLRSGGPFNSDPASANKITGGSITTPSSTLFIMAPSALTVESQITGNFDVVLAGGRTKELRSTTSNYTGATYVTGFGRAAGNLLPGVAGAFGQSTQPIYLLAGNVTPTDPVRGVATGQGSVALFTSETNTAATTWGRNIIVTGGGFARIGQVGSAVAGPLLTISGGITLEDTDLTVQSFNPDTPIAMTGVVTGTGALRIIGPGPVTLTGANTHTGGTDLDTSDVRDAANVVPGAGTLIINSAAALGSGPLFINDGGGLQATGTTPVTIPNEVIFQGATGPGGGGLVFNDTGASPGTPGPKFTFSGPVTLDSGDIGVSGDATTATDFDDIVTEWSGVGFQNDNVAEFSGPVGGSAGLAVYGPGTLILSGSNTFYGELSVGNPFDFAVTGTTVELRGDNSIGTLVDPLDPTNRGRGFGVVVNPNNRLLISQSADLVGGTLTLRNGDGINGGGAVVVPNNLNVTYAGSVISFSDEPVANPTTSKPGTFSVGTNSTLDFSGDFISGIGTPAAGSGDTAGRNSGLVLLGAGTLEFRSVSARSLTALNGTVRIAADGLDDTDGDSTSLLYGAPNLGSVPGARTGKLDITDNALVIDYSTTPVSATEIRGLIQQGRNGGNWLGNGITSSTAAGAPGTLGVGYANNATQLMRDGVDAMGNPVYNELGGISIGDTGMDQFLVKLTLLGDANLDGVVNVTDLGNLAANFRNPADWFGGDFNYDGIVNVTDLGFLAANFRQVLGSTTLASGPSLAAAFTQVGLPLELLNQIPEPGMLGLAGVAGLGLRRRRKVA